MSEWIVVTSFASGDVAYYGEGARGRVGRVPYKGNAYRFPREIEALAAGYRAKEDRLIGDFRVEELPPKPRFKTTPDGKEGSV